MSLSGISLKATNTSNKQVKLNVLGGSADSSSQNGANTIYEWNLGSETYANVNQVTIYAKNQGAANFLPYTTFLGDFTPQGVADALSTLNLGFFLVTGAVVYTYNSQIEFGTLELGGNPFDFNTFMVGAYAFFDPTNYFGTQSAFNAAFSNCFLNALNQIPAALGAYETYGYGVFLPLQYGPNLNASGASLIFTPSSPKVAGLQPIYIDDSFVQQQGYTLTPSTTEANGIIVYPSGDASEITSIALSNMAIANVYMDPVVYANLSTYSSQAQVLSMTINGNFDDLPALVNFDLSPNASIVYSSGNTQPNLNLSATTLRSIQLDFLSGTAPTTTFTTPSDFQFGASAQLDVIILESFSNIMLDFNFVLFNIATTFLIQGNNSDITLASNFNQFYNLKTENGFSGVPRFRLFDVLGTNGVIFQDYVTPLQCNGWEIVTFDNCKLTNFPLIGTMNQYQNAAGSIYRQRLNLPTNNLPVSVVNQILIDMDNASNGFTTYLAGSLIVLSGQTPPAPPSGAGATAKTNLIGKGFSVITD
jgi:hypothetical protein